LGVIVDTSQRIASLGITATVEPSTEPLSEGFDSQARRWDVTLRRADGRTMTVGFTLGSGHHGRTPNAGEVLECVASDAASVENAASFGEWADDFGVDSFGSVASAERMYRATVDQTASLRAFLGDDFDAVVFETENDHY
jgi:hypothetical protein